MAVVVTTPTAVPGTVTTPVVPAATLSIDKVFADALHLVFTRITAVGVKHLVVPPPMSRWDGTSWVPTYSPKA